MSVEKTKTDKKWPVSEMWVRMNEVVDRLYGFPESENRYLLPFEKHEEYLYRGTMVALEQVMHLDGCEGRPDNVLTYMKGLNKPKDILELVAYYLNEINCAPR